MTTQPAHAAAVRRERLARAWGLERGVVLVASGLPVPVAGTDQYHEFHAHGEFRYLTGLGMAGAVLTFDPGEGWVLFAPVASTEERIWVGDWAPPAEIGAQSGLDRVRPARELGAWLERRRGEPLAMLGNPDIRLHSPGYGIPDWTHLEIARDDDMSSFLGEQVAVARRAKDGWEVDRMRLAAAASAAGHLLALRSVRPGQSERAVQVEIEAEFFRHGADRTAYGSIVGSGANGAVLHFSPTQRTLRDGDLVLIDAGAEYEGYASDVTRTFPAGRAFSGDQRDLYQLVLETQEAAIDAARPGVEYRDLHMAACFRLAAGLRDLGILRGAPADLVERDAHALFFPHGLGHMLGLATHDVGGCLAGRAPSDRFGLKWLRADLPLQPGYVVTIEPGLYFIPAILRDPDLRARYRDAVDWDRVDGLSGFGGIRIEDDVLITGGEPDVLTKEIAKDLGSIEALRAMVIT